MSRSDSQEGEQRSPLGDLLGRVRPRLLRLRTRMVHGVFLGMFLLALLVLYAALAPQASFVRIDVTVTDVAFQVPRHEATPRTLPLLDPAARWHRLFWNDVAEIGSGDPTTVEAVARVPTSLPLKLRPPAALLLSRHEPQRLSIRLLPPRIANGAPGTDRRELGLDLSRDLLSSFVTDGLPGGTHPIELESAGPAPEIVLYPEHPGPQREFAIVGDGGVGPRDGSRIRLALPAGPPLQLGTELWFEDRVASRTASFLELPIQLESVRFHQGRSGAPESFILGGTIAFPNGEAAPIQLGAGALVRLRGRDLMLRRAELGFESLQVGIDGIVTDLRVGHAASTEALPDRQPRRLDAFFAKPARVEAALALLGLLAAVLGGVLFSNEERSAPPDDEQGLFAKASRALAKLEKTEHARLVIAAMPRARVRAGSWRAAVAALREALAAALPETAHLLPSHGAGGRAHDDHGPTVLEIVGPADGLLDVLSRPPVLAQELRIYPLLEHRQVFATRADGPAAG